MIKILNIIDYELNASDTDYPDYPDTFFINCYAEIMELDGDIRDRFLTDLEMDSYQELARELRFNNG